jgi:Ca2+-transporting ATPase
MGFIFAVHVPIAGLAILPLLFGLPILFGPMHIAFLEMIIDPVCSLVFEAETEEDDVMSRPPRPPDQPLFSGALIGWSLVQGTFAFALVAVIYVIALNRGMPEEEVRALAFFSLVLAIVSLIFVNRSFSASLITALRRPNVALGWVLLAVPVMLSLTLLFPPVSALFRFGPLHLDDLALTFGAGVLVLVFLEALKSIWRGRLSYSSQTRVRGSDLGQFSCPSYEMLSGRTYRATMTPRTTNDTIELRVDEIAQLFHTLDPFPFRERPRSGGIYRRLGA